MLRRTKLRLIEFLQRTPLRLIEQKPEEPQPIEAPPAHKEEDPLIEISTGSETSEEFNEKVRNAVRSIPDNIRKYLSEKKYNIIVGRYLSDTLAEEQNPNNWNSVSSAFYYPGKRVVVAELVKVDDQEMLNLNVEGTLRHAIGHALDETSDEVQSSHRHPRFSDLEVFKYAHTSDIARLNQENKVKLAYYVDGADSSRSELFAECFAAINGGGAVYTIEVMSKYFSASIKQVKDILNELGSD